MADNLKADSALIAQKAKEFQEQHNNLMLAIRQLKADEDAVTNGANWQGQARDAFNAFMERYYFQADKMNDKLMETSEKLVKMSGQFQDQDTDFASKVQQQVSSLDLPAL
ncbi:WXG100 family type VII secretion target [Nocardia amikacinitolerans]|uniref:ESAT-6-like protein n=1 Tax=Nocardia amikacinitolerans TaxID=756689 RepID=A0A285LSU8_9NOCA|nr:WXG100 family type VII secretion target [Nocardia amikacinitolerans]MCP2289278.1 WXG100 family type VII secretion target [Nocardia amikacinitolerans]MCP2317613.1 WXG100 family type VII secretion target [Nocardia amikacinitolerans]SNY87989.1 WXG100 family type VII secretion target [Nocardia amikacinitolerans]